MYTHYKQTVSVLIYTLTDRQSMRLTEKGNVGFDSEVELLLYYKLVLAMFVFTPVQHVMACPCGRLFPMVDLHLK